MHESLNECCLTIQSIDKLPKNVAESTINRVLNRNQSETRDLAS